MQPSIATTTSPVLPVPPLRSPTASQSSPWRTAISSSAAYTASSNERPLAVPRSASCATASAFSFSARARSSSTTRPCIRSLISRRRACCWSDVCFIAPSQARWKTANGLSSESAVNCLRRSSRITPIASASAALSWFCTATDDSSPKCFVSTRATWPFSGPNASSNLRSNTSATARERSANSAWDSRAVFSSSAFTNSTLAPVCSRFRTRAPISSASATTAAGSSPASTRARTSSTTVGSSIANPSTSTRLARTVMRGWRSGVAAASMGRTSQRTPCS